jgi:plastocyanin
MSVKENLKILYNKDMKSIWGIIISIVVIILLGWIIYAVTGSHQTVEAPSNTETTNTQTQTETTPPVNTNVQTNTTVTTPTTSHTDSFTITATNFTYNPKDITVKKGDTVKITLVNSNGVHDLVVDGYNVRTNIIQGGQSQTITFVANQSGDFQYYCSVDGHRAMGMWGTLHVQG